MYDGFVSRKLTTPAQQRHESGEKGRDGLCRVMEEEESVDEMRRIVADEISERLTETACAMNGKTSQWQV